MSRYVGQSSASRTAGALGAVIIASVALVAFYLSLWTRYVGIGDENFHVFTITPPPPPPPIERPRPEPAHRHRPNGAASPANLRATATPVVAPPLPPRPSPVIAAPKPATGAAANAGASDRPGPGTGAGGQGNGTGSGDAGNGSGEGDGDGPELIRGEISNRDYPKGALGAGASGTVRTRFTVGVNGRVSGCVVTGSSGNAELDATTCRLITQRFRFAPARDAAGRPVADEAEGEQRWSTHGREAGEDESED